MSPVDRGFAVKPEQKGIGEFYSPRKKRINEPSKMAAALFGYFEVLLF